MKQTGIKSFCASSSVERPTTRVDRPTTSPTRRGRKRAAAPTHAGENVKKPSNAHASVDPPQVVAKEGRAGVTSLGDDAEVVFSPKLLPSRKCKELFGKLEQEVQWEHREIRMLGRYIMQPRLVAYMASDPSLRYTYSGVTVHPAAWSSTVLEIKALMEEMCGGKVVFNSCLLNLYRDGNDHQSWHSDNESLYGPRPTIGSFSLGAERDFMMKRTADKNDKWRFPLGDGTGLIMRGTTQDHWIHSVPKRAKVASARINLTFRTIVNIEQPEE
eukprot:CAMPEP_0198215920 /NCGR_PEP_ID=MMETSP1445-20131203/53539_1 /TAXON_ID=36898 /ORGANISM="Pyramimonas sp., Strain CCMP2087" /LENGTH=271 /DNA_ID=CAMNT_0043891885 /DNA_START=153 /DNA_END=968 /DNA_ORIENTATION=-